MSRGRAGEEHIRKLYKVGQGSYSLTLPITAIRTLKWQEDQKVTVHVNEKTKEITIRDWKG